MTEQSPDGLHSLEELQEAWHPTILAALVGKSLPAALLDVLDRRLVLLSEGEMGLGVEVTADPTPARLTLAGAGFAGEAAA